ncbi:MAG: Gfo/Idh/MocA family protein [Kiritimatiellia bacterium]
MRKTGHGVFWAAGILGALAAAAAPAESGAAYRPPDSGLSVAEALRGPAWRPTPNRKIRAVLWGIVHNHARGKFDAMRKLKDDYEIVGWVDDSSSPAMRMAEPQVGAYTNYPRCTPQQVFDAVKPDLIVVEVSNSELADVALECAKRGYPMHMDKPLGTALEAFKPISDICRARNIPLQTGYMFRANEAIQFVVKSARDGLIGDVFAIDADLNHSYGGAKYPAYASAYPGGTVYLLACHVIEYALPLMRDVMPDACYSIVKPAPGDPEGTPNNTLTIMEWPRCLATIRVCSRGTQPRRHLRVDGTDGTLEIVPIEDFSKVKHDLGGVKAEAMTDLVVRLYLKKDKPGYKKGRHEIRFASASDRYAGQLRELAQILRGEKPNPVGLYDHDLRVHRVSLQACNIAETAGGK